MLVWFLDQGTDCPMRDSLAASFQLLAARLSVFFILYVLFYKYLMILLDNTVDMMSNMPLQQRRATVQGAVRVRV